MIDLQLGIVVFTVDCVLRRRMDIHVKRSSRNGAQVLILLNHTRGSCSPELVVLLENLHVVYILDLDWLSFVVIVVAPDFLLSIICIFNNMFSVRAASYI